MKTPAPLLTESRVIDLEIRLTHQELMLQALDAGMIQQQRTMDALALQVDILREQLRATQASAPTDDTPPPHY